MLHFPSIVPVSLRRSVFLILIYPLLILKPATGQVTSIAYAEDFNNGPNGWIIGGYSPSWSYGIPTLTNIVSNGTNCFVTADAGQSAVEPFTSCFPPGPPTTNGNFYNCCERSFVESPLIDLTGVNSPLLSIDINLFCEQTFDGAKLQLSVNGGTTWMDIGTYSSSVYQSFPNTINCREKNWYNKSNINYLSSTNGGCGQVNYSFGGGNAGWSGGCAQSSSGACGSPDPHGTNGWVTATHCISQAANKNAVKIRMVFGAGSQIYSDGIAFDNVIIYNSFPLSDFSYSLSSPCEPEITLTNLTDCAALYSWDFGHPSVPGNTSPQPEPVHLFPGPGNYSVTLTSTDFCGGVSTVMKNVTVPNSTGININSVQVSASGLCNSSIDSMQITLSPVTPGTGPFTVSFVFNGQVMVQSGNTNNPILVTGLSPGQYDSITVTDVNGCTAMYPGNVVIPFNSDGITVDAGINQVVEAGSAVLLSASSNQIAAFEWSPGTFLDDPYQQSTVSTPETSITYTVTATSVNGCTAADVVTLTIKEDGICNLYFLPNSFTPNRDGKNEIFKIYIDPSLRVKEFNMSVYNRWGQVIFQSDNPESGWDGEGQPSGIYAVITNLKCKSGKTSNFKGTIALIR